MSTDRMILAKLPPIGSHAAQGISAHTRTQYDGLSGPNYTIKGTMPRYHLPPPNVLKPHQDTKAGGLDTWPAHATGHTSTTSVQLTKDNQLALVDEEAQGKPQIVPKPKFLEQLEEFLKKELRALGVTNVSPNELRLQAHREVFEYLIEDFKTYKPLLSAVKNEYEMMLSWQREQIRQMEPLKQMLVTVSEQCDQKIMNIRDQEKQDMVDLKKENQALYTRIDELRNEQRALEAQVEKLQEELAAEYLRYRDECDARKLLVADINDLRYQQEDALMSKQSMQELEEEKDDPVTLKIALRRAREDEANATQRLNEMIANYGDVIPRRDYEGQQQKVIELEKEMLEMRDDFKKLQDEHDALLQTYKQVLKQRDDFYVESEQLRRTATPRPEWEKCADHVAGGISRWKELSEGKTSKELVDVLLQEITGGGGGMDMGGAEYFDGQGTGSTVPKYLQYEGKVRNRRLGKRDCNLLIRDIWREKGAHDAGKTDGKREELADFLHTYLQRRFGIEQLVVEWGYNLHDACQRYAHDQPIGTFWSILTGEMDEELHHQDIEATVKLLNHLTRLDVERGNLGSLSKADFQTALGEFFPSFDDSVLTALSTAAETELEAKEAETLEYKNLFLQDDEGHVGPFLDAVKKQIRQERIQYVEEIKAALDESNPVTLNELQRAITLVDPEIEQADIDRYLSWAFKCQRENFDKADPEEQSSLISRLQNGNIKRIGKRQ